MFTQHGSSGCLPAATGHCAQHSNRAKQMLGRGEHLQPVQVLISISETF